MEQIRQFRFEDFKAEKLEQGYKEVLERRWDPNTENEIHHHEFTAWGKERTKAIFDPANNCKDPAYR